MVAIPAAIGVGVLRKIAAQAATQAPQGIASARGVSKELFGYDFVGLIIKLSVLQIIAWLFAKFMESVISLTGGWFTFIKLLGFNVPAKEQMPAGLIQLFTTGYQGFKYWDFVKALTMVLLVWEALQYYKTNKDNGAQPSPMTMGIFTVLIGSVGVVTVPELLHRAGVGNGGSNSQYFSLGSKTSIQAGDSLNIGASQLVPNAPLTLGVVGNSYTQSHTASAEGTLLAFFYPPVSLSPGSYRIYLDQTAAGGPRYEASFTILEGIAA